MINWQAHLVLYHFLVSIFMWTNNYFLSKFLSKISFQFLHAKRNVINNDNLIHKFVWSGTVSCCSWNLCLHLTLKGAWKDIKIPLASFSYQHLTSLTHQKTSIQQNMDASRTDKLHLEWHCQSWTNTTYTKYS